MALFGGGIPGYGGGMFPMESPFGGPIDFGMEGINQALAQNSQVQPKPKKGFGEFLRAFAGHLGDNLSGNPVYAQMQQQQAEMKRMEELYERKRQDEMTDWKAKQDYEAANKKPNYEGNIDHYNQALELGLIPRGTSYRGFLGMVNPNAFIPPAPTVLPFNAVEVGGEGGGLPRVSNPAEYEALPAGTTFMDPQGNIRTKGGQSAAPTGGFP